MNPGVYSFMILTVIGILFLTGWGTRFVLGTRLRNLHWAGLLFGVAIAAFFDLRIAKFLINSGTLIIFALMALYVISFKRPGYMLQFLLAVVTSAACSFTMMLLVPHDPAFYLLESQYLYPAVAVLASYLISREPLFCLNASVTGILLAGIFHDNRLAVHDSVLRIGGPELMDLTATVLMMSMAADGFVFLWGMVLARLSRRQPGKLEGDPT
ncbi:YphA family membrane protein [Effusibacillus lacus]|uniref:Uncharacterized protein n=1 Tax=Effusibacillus lacus TaxID=1348429 RepID=A0A292YLQ4_9BACL|nr:hypothetical protein [Effusibacillus lacus]TCS75265.1 hypothetical protein EDD64_10815 [Effusibacillus lacus]GAX89703.1 hypothetical protein EFBL_1327 [Effusibacillus lacus]